MSSHNSNLLLAMIGLSSDIKYLWEEIEQQFCIVAFFFFLFRKGRRRKNSFQWEFRRNLHVMGRDQNSVSLVQVNWAGGGFSSSSQHQIEFREREIYEKKKARREIIRVIWSWFEENCFCEICLGRFRCGSARNFPQSYIVCETFQSKKGLFYLHMGFCWVEAEWKMEDARQNLLWKFLKHLELIA